MDNLRNLQLVTEAARVLRAQLLDGVLEDGDDDALRDTIEGELPLHELIAQVDAMIVSEEAHIEGLDAAIRKLVDRKRRLEDRVDLYRAAIVNAMAIGEVVKITTPTGTLSRKVTPPKVVVTSEADVPADYWRQPDPVLDKKSLLAALKDGATIPGAELSNGGETLAIRR